MNLEALKKNYSNWGLKEFAIALNLDTGTQYTKDLFLKFGQMVRLLGEFDSETLKKLSS